MNWLSLALLAPKIPVRLRPSARLTSWLDDLFRQSRISEWLDDLLRGAKGKLVPGLEEWAETIFVALSRWLRVWARDLLRTEEARKAFDRLDQALSRYYAFLSDLGLLIVFCVACGLTILGLLLVYKWLMRRRLGVFVSFSRSREDTARELEEILGKDGMRVFRLPYQEEAGHQDVVRPVGEGIDACDALVCIPAGTRSFVDSEVAQARGGKKAVLFLLSERGGTLPDSADKQYPVFRLEATAGERFQPLIDFLRYIGADLRATWDLLRRAFRHPALLFGSGWMTFGLMALSLGVVWLLVYLRVLDVGRELALADARFAAVEKDVVVVHSIALAAAATPVFLLFSFSAWIVLSLEKQRRAWALARLKVKSGEFVRDDWIGKVPGLDRGGRIYQCLFEAAPLAHHEAARAQSVSSVS